MPVVKPMRKSETTQDCTRCAEFDAQASVAAGKFDRSAQLDIRIRRDEHRESQFCRRAVS